ncbi:MAG TPA: helix-turn-helix transcriptional regulator [Coleofasciculaceae cyanobacterium]
MSSSTSTSQEPRIDDYAAKLRQSPSFRDLLLANVAMSINQQRLKKQSPRSQSSQDLVQIYQETERLGALQKKSITRLEKLFKEVLKKEIFWQQSAQWIVTRLDAWEADNHPPQECSIPGILSVNLDASQPEDLTWRESLVMGACAFYIASDLVRQLQITHYSVEELEALLGIREGVSQKTKNLKTSPPLFHGKEFEKVATGYPILTGAQALINSQWQDGQYPYWRKLVGDGFIEHQIIRQSPETRRIELVPGKAAWEIIQQFGPEAAYIFLIFSSYATDSAKPWEGEIKLKGTDLIRLYGWDKRTDLTLGKKLKKIGNLVELVCSLSVLISNIDIGNKRYNIATSAMWILEELEYSGQLALTVNGDRPDEATYEAEDPDELLIRVRPGSWTEKFFSQHEQSEKEALRQYGYLAKSTLQINPYRKRLAAKLAIFLTVMSRIQTSNCYEVAMLLEQVESPNLIQDIQHSKVKRNQLIEQWDSALLTLNQLGWEIEFDPDTYPESIRPAWSFAEDSAKASQPRPQQWLDLWLKAKIAIRPTHLIQQQLATAAPLALHAGQSIPDSVRSQSLEPPATVSFEIDGMEEIPGVVLEKALALKGLTKAKLAAHLSLDRSMITRWIKGSRPIQPKHREQLWQLLGPELLQVMGRTVP